MSQLSGAMTNLVYRCRYQRGDEVRLACGDHLAQHGSLYFAALHNFLT